MPRLDADKFNVDDEVRSMVEEVFREVVRDELWPLSSTNRPA